LALYSWFLYRHGAFKLKATSTLQECVTGHAKTYGLRYVGYYLSSSAVLTLIGLLLIRETKDEDLAGSKV
jgi:hypothetical protein